MAGIFLSEDLKKLFKHKKVVFMGDSNVRSYYKDFLCLLHQSEIIEQKVLKAKMENSVFGDILLNEGEKTNGRHYCEERRFVDRYHDLSFFFLTRVYSEYVEDILQMICSQRPPDVLIINSCLWDIARWGPNGVEEYKENVVTLAKRMRKLLPKECLVMWLTAPPLAAQPYGGFLLVQLEFLKYVLRFHVMEANAYASKVFSSHGFDVLDLHFHFRMQVERRGKDGVHWQPLAVRYITNLILSHISVAWGVIVPRRYDSHVLDRVLENSDCVKNEDDKENDNDNEETGFPVDRQNKIPEIKKKVKPVSTVSYAKQKRVAEAHKRIRAWRNEKPTTSHRRYR